MFQCVGCQKPNEYQSGPYVCFECAGRGVAAPEEPTRPARPITWEATLVRTIVESHDPKTFVVTLYDDKRNVVGVFDDNHLEVTERLDGWGIRFWPSTTYAFVKHFELWTSEGPTFIGAGEFEPGIHLTDGKEVALSFTVNLK